MNSVFRSWIGRGFAVVEAGRSSRSLPLVFLAFAALFASAAWLRPAFSADLSGFHLPLRFTSGPAGYADEILYGPRMRHALSPATPVLAAIVLGAILVAWKPRRLPSVAGAILAAAIVGNAVTALNYPALIERMDHEFEQRNQIAGPFTYRRNQEDGLATKDNARFGPWAVLTGEEQRGDPGRGWAYLVYGFWLIPLAVAGVIATDPRPLPARFGRLALWTGLGLALAALACMPRLRGEAAWLDAVRLDGEGDAEAAAEALERSARCFPELGQLERAWMLAGKLDFRRNRSTPAATSYLVYQNMRDKRRPRAIAYNADVAWQMRRVTDYREGIQKAPGGFDFGLDAGSIGGWTFDRRLEVERSASGGTGLLLRVNNVRELETAKHLAETLRVGPEAHQSAVRHLTARTMAEIGLEVYLSNFVEGDDGRVPWPRSRTPEAARQFWLEAVKTDPHRFDLPYYLGVVESLNGGPSPERVQAAFAPLLKNAVDRPIQADALCEIGDAYFRAGRLEEARKFYVESYDLFNIPEQHKNYRAQRRLGGL